MEILIVLFLLFFIAFILGMIKPSLVMRWGKEKTRKKMFVYYGIPFLILFVIIGIFGKPKEIKENQLIVEKAAEEKTISIEKQKEKDESKKIAIIENFTANKLSIIEGIKHEYEKGLFQEVLDNAEKYLVTNDPDLRKIYEDAKVKLKEKEENDFWAMVENGQQKIHKNGQQKIHIKLLFASPKGMEMLKKYNIVIYKSIEPKVNPIWIRQRVMEKIKSDFDRNFLSSIGLSIFDVGMNNASAQFKRDYTYTDPRTGKNKKSKRVYRSFRVLNDGTVQEEGGYKNGIIQLGERAVYKELNSLEMNKESAYLSNLYDTMLNENGFNKQEYERLSAIDYQYRLERQKQEYIDMVNEYNENNQ